MNGNSTSGRASRRKAVALGYRSVFQIVNERLIVEIKATEKLHPAATRQLRNYLRATNLEIGLLLHFGREPKVHREFYENRLKRFPL